MDLGPVAAALGQDILDLRPVPGGDINATYRLQTTQGVYFVKWNADPPPGFFQAEARGLELLCSGRTGGGPRVPRPIVHGQRFLVLEWIETAGGRADRRLGRELAALHRLTASGYGLEEDNYIGTLPQPNAPSDSWTEFYAQRRLRPLGREAARRGVWNSERERRLEALRARLDQWLLEEPPALIHGDLWAGNYLVAATSEPVLVDPAPYYGARELDLAMSQLFGGFGPDFYAAYGEAYPQPPGWEERRPLYQLYYLLVHLVLFGQGYGGRVDAILRRFT